MPDLPDPSRGLDVQGYLLRPTTEPPRMTRRDSTDAHTDAYRSDARASLEGNDTASAFTPGPADGSGGVEAIPLDWVGEFRQRTGTIDPRPTPPDAGFRNSIRRRAARGASRREHPVLRGVQSAA